MEPKNLKLIARTNDDLRVISAHLQDSIVNIKDIATSEIKISVLIESDYVELAIRALHSSYNLEK